MSHAALQLFQSLRCRIRATVNSGFFQCSFLFAESPTHKRKDYEINVPACDSILSLSQLFVSNSSIF